MATPPRAPHRFRPLLRWLPAGVLGVSQAVAWAAMFGGGMAGVTAWVALLAIIPMLGVGSLLVTAAYAGWKRRVSTPIVMTLLLAASALWPGAWLLEFGRIAYPASLSSSAPEASVRLPSDLPLQVVWGGDDIGTNQHAFTPDQRWAYDLVIAPYFGGSSRPEDYGCWGKPVLAVAAARVAAMHDAEPDVEAARLTPTEHPLGNFVALELPSKTYIIIAHLQRGSVAVREGDDVAEGQLLGRCGNSGNTSEPHIHIHHQRQDPKQFPVNFAEGLPLFFRDHDGARMPRGGVTEEAGRAIATGDLVQHRR